MKTIADYKKLISFIEGRLNVVHAHAKGAVMTDRVTSARKQIELIEQTLKKIKQFKSV